MIVVLNKGTVVFSIELNGESSNCNFMHEFRQIYHFVLMMVSIRNLSFAMELFFFLKLKIRTSITLIRIIEYVLEDNLTNMF